MRIVVFGATGNVGSSLVRLLAADPAVDSVVGVARRRPEGMLDGVTWVATDVATDALEPILSGADAVVHLAWLIQPSHDEKTLHRANVVGSGRVFEAVTRAGVPVLVYASSVGAYSPGPKDRLVQEDWPTGGVDSSFYSRHKAEVERQLDDVERAHPQLRVVRLRPGLIFKRTAASGIRRLFVGPLLPGWALRPSLVPVVPDVPGLMVQAVHAADVAEAYHQALLRNVRGAFNVAAEPPLDAGAIARILGARPVRVGRGLARRTLALTWQLHLQPTPPGWLDLGLSAPLMDCSRARAELGWVPLRSAEETLRELIEGLRDGADEETPPLAAGTGGPLRLRELASGVGARGGVPAGRRTTGRR
jgi:nucleoside-diphosphate-sugar epimerase